MDKNNSYINISKIKREERIKKIVNNIITAVIIIGLSFVILYPLISAFIPAITQYNYLGEPNSIWIPKKTSGLAFTMAIDLLDYEKTLPKSLFYALIMALIQVVVSAITGYGFSKLKFKGSNLLFSLVILTIILPEQAIMLPQYLHFQRLNLINKISTLFILAIFGQGLKSGLFIYLFRQFFKSLPIELEEAAYIDGCGFFKTFFKIILPNAGSIILTVLVFSFVWNYSDIYYTNWLAKNAGLLGNVINHKFGNDAYITGLYQDYIAAEGNSVTPLFVGAVRGAGTILYITPLVILYFIIQRKFVQGFERSGITGQ